MRAAHADGHAPPASLGSLDQPAHQLAHTSPRVADAIEDVFPLPGQTRRLMGGGGATIKV